VSGDPLDVAARALRHRDRSRADVAARLERAGVDAAARDEALEMLERVGYVDDRRFARSRAEALAGRGRSDAAIRYELEGGGAAPEAIDEALARLPPERERAIALVRRGGAAAAGRLGRAGFGEDAVEAALAALDVAGGSPLA
jgi:SOS response regulatory protein OraA/RecX